VTTKLNFLFKKIQKKKKKKREKKNLGWSYAECSMGVAARYTGVVFPLPPSIITEGRKPRGSGWAIT
jgi:hypothetical protein